MTPENPTTTPAPAPNEPGSTPSLLNEAQLASLTKSEEICRTALKADYLLALVTLEAGEEEKAAKSLVAQVRECQARARQKHFSNS